MIASFETKHQSLLVVVGEGRPSMPLSRSAPQAVEAFADHDAVGPVPNSKRLGYFASNPKGGSAGGLAIKQGAKAGWLSGGDVIPLCGAASDHRSSVDT
ncbi:MAG TPA: hypothetical protein VFG62_03300 [Rhodopila sp.]|nr:hypothetical protein [Rhodopila sp.]